MKGAGVKMDNTQILYELKNYQQKLNFEMNKLRNQLVLAERKLERTDSDVLICLLMFSVPLFVSVIFDYLYRYLSAMLAPLFFLARLLWVFTMPFTLYALIKSIVVRRMNRDTPDFVWQKPDVRRIPPKSTPEAETSYLAEQKKLTWVLGKYFLYQEHLQQLLQQAAETDEALTLESVRAELKAMPFYEEIKPTNPFKSNEVKNAGILSAIIIIILFTSLFIFTLKL